MDSATTLRSGLRREAARSNPPAYGSTRGRAGRSMVWSERAPPRHARRLAGSPASEASGLAASFPLIFFGAGLTFVGVYVRLLEPTSAVGHIPLWLPFLILGVVALGGGILSVFARPSEPARPSASPGTSPDPGPSRESSVVRGPPHRYHRRGRPSESLPPGRYPPTPPAAPQPRGTEPADRGPVTLGGRDAGDRAPARRIAPDEPTLLLGELASIEADLRPRGVAKLATSRGLVAEDPARRLATRAGDPADRSRDPTAAPSRPSPPQRRDLVAGDTPGTPAVCTGCGSRIAGPTASVRCLVCDRPLCPACADGSERDGAPGLCPFCAVLDALPDAVQSGGGRAAPAGRLP